LGLSGVGLPFLYTLAFLPFHIHSCLQSLFHHFFSFLGLLWCCFCSEFSGFWISSTAFLDSFCRFRSMHTIPFPADACGFLVFHAVSFSFYIWSLPLPAFCVFCRSATCSAVAFLCVTRFLQNHRSTVLLEPPAVCSTNTVRYLRSGLPPGSTCRFLGLDGSCHTFVYFSTVSTVYRLVSALWVTVGVFWVARWVERRSASAHITPLSLLFWIPFCVRL